MRVPTVPKYRLLLIAGVVWCLAGAMVMAVGVPLQVRLAPEHLILVPLSVGIFALFYRFVFSPLLHKHARRIQASEAERLPCWQFFTPSSWAVMAVMMAAGMVLRATHVLPDEAIAFFYSGLGLALFLCGLRFVATFLGRETPGIARGSVTTGD